MISFLNDRSLEEYTDWAAALKTFLLAVQELRATDTSVFRDGVFFQSGTFKQRFNNLAFPKDVRALVLLLIFSDRYCRCWRSTRISTTDDTFSCHNPAMHLRDESMAEGAERRNRDQATIVSLLSAADSRFGGIENVQIRKDGWPNAIDLWNTSSLRTVSFWISQQRGYYDRNSTAAPKDFQTVLEKQPARFVRTPHRERRASRRIFQEQESGRRYYVDDAHFGMTAHLEVFSAEGVHLGIADIDNGDLDADGRVEGRVLRL
jgi:hypothetical protein